FRAYLEEKTPINVGSKEIRTKPLKSTPFTPVASPPRGVQSRPTLGSPGGEWMNADSIGPLRDFPTSWRHRHLLDLESLTAEEITLLLDIAEELAAELRSTGRKLSLLAGRTIANLFYENSTRTRNSFSLAAKRLGADTIEFSSSGSSVSKGETFI